VALVSICTGDIGSELNRWSHFKKRLTKYAENIVKLKRPIFLSTMWELNADWFPWGGKPKESKKLWRHIWQIFEDSGANDYTTWVWEVFCTDASKRADRPNRYYPGDKYVDWIGLSAYSRDKYPNGSGGKSFAELVDPTYTSMRVSHPNKPIMMSEFAKTTGRSQHRWLEYAFIYIRSIPGMKAAVFWNNYSAQEEDEHTLTDKSLLVYKKIMKDPYFIGSKK